MTDISEILGSSAEDFLEHHGVQGQKWGKIGFAAAPDVKSPAIARRGADNPADVRKALAYIQATKGGKATAADKKKLPPSAQAALEAMALGKAAYLKAHPDADPKDPKAALAALAMGKQLYDKKHANPDKKVPDKQIKPANHNTKPTSAQVTGSQGTKPASSHATGSHGGGDHKTPARTRRKASTSSKAALRAMAEGKAAYLKLHPNANQNDPKEALKALALGKQLADKQHPNANKMHQQGVHKNPLKPHASGTPHYDASVIAAKKAGVPVHKPSVANLNKFLEKATPKEFNAVMGPINRKYLRRHPGADLEHPEKQPFFKDYQREGMIAAAKALNDAAVAAKKAREDARKAKQAAKDKASAFKGLDAALERSHHVGHDAIDEFVDDVLAHYGVKGMHWGVRKANRSGTNAGPPNTKPAFSGGGGPGRKAVSKLERHGVRALSDNELKIAVQRLDLEKRVSTLRTKEKSSGRKFSEDLGKQAAKMLSTEAIKLAIKAALAG